MLRKGSVAALSFVPAPGVPSLVQRDPGGAAVAAAVAVSTSVLWVSAVRATAQHPTEEWLLSIAGCYTASVLASHFAGLGSRERAGRLRATVAPLPRPSGEVAPGVVVHATLR